MKPVTYGITFPPQGPETTIERNNTYFTVVLTKKRPRYHVEKAQPFSVKYDTVFIDIVWAPFFEAAIFDTLMNYFTARLIKKWHPLRRPLSKKQIEEVRQACCKLTSSAMRKLGTPQQMIVPYIYPWEPNHGTIISFEEKS